MTKQLFAFLKIYSQVPIKVDRLIVSSFLHSNKITVKHNLFLKKYVIESKAKKEYASLIDFIGLLKKNNVPKIHFEDLIELFEFVISPADKEINGAVYTPEYIRHYIIKEALGYKQKINDIKVGDISCGCGGFLFDAAMFIKNKTGKTYYEIFKSNIFGLDITSYSINRTKILLTLLALYENEDKKEFYFNLYVGNALNFKWAERSKIISSNNGFDVIVGNPPYVGTSKITEASRKHISKWSVTKSGKADLYIPFFQIGLENLNDSGILGYITVNTFYKSVNGRALRQYFSENKFDITMIDFGGEQVFKGRSTYTCICIIEKKRNGKIHYAKTESKKINELRKGNFENISYSILDNHEGWLLNDVDTVNNINKIQNIGIPLGEIFDIRNGFATLRNDVYVFVVKEERNGLYKFEKDGKEYWIEKEICRNAIKPNILKSEADTNHNIEKIIFPYETQPINQNGSSKMEIKIFSEELFRRHYPLAYSYLSEYKDELKKRDKGKKEYEKWYAFGRSQALNIKGKKLLFPYIADNPYFVLTEDSDLLFYNGYAILSKSKAELLWLQKILKSKIFWYYIINSSKPYDNNYFSLAKNYVKNFGICTLSEQEKNTLMNLKQPAEIDSFLINKYQVEL